MIHFALLFSLNNNLGHHSIQYIGSFCAHGCTLAIAGRDDIFFNQSPVNGTLVYFQFFIITNNPAVSNFIHVSFDVCDYS